MKEASSSPPGLDLIHGLVYDRGMKARRRTRRVEWDRERIRALRQHLGLTQADLAAELGTRQQTISEWETGMYRPRGASSTLLSIVAERAGFDYKVNHQEKG